MIDPGYSSISCWGRLGSRPAGIVSVRGCVACHMSVPKACRQNAACVDSWSCSLLLREAMTSPLSPADA